MAIKKEEFPQEIALVRMYDSDDETTFIVVDSDNAEAIVSISDDADNNVAIYELKARGKASAIFHINLEEKA